MVWYRGHDTLYPVAKMDRTGLRRKTVASVQLRFPEIIPLQPSILLPFSGMALILDDGWVLALPSLFHVGVSYLSG